MLMIDVCAEAARRRWKCATARLGESESLTDFLPLADGMRLINHVYQVGFNVVTMIDRAENRAEGAKSDADWLRSDL
jgi:hypothetical protein